MNAAGAGFTLVELMVAMVIMTIGVGVATATLWAPLESSEDALGQAQRAAVDSVRWEVLWSDSAHLIPPTMAMPDGRIVEVRPGWPR